MREGRGSVHRPRFNGNKIIYDVIKKTILLPVVICSVSSLLKNLIIVDSVVDKLVIHCSMLTIILQNKFTN